MVFTAVSWKQSDIHMEDIGFRSMILDMFMNHLVS